MYIKLLGVDVVLLMEGNIIGCDIVSVIWIWWGLRFWYVNMIFMWELGDFFFDYLLVLEMVCIGKMRSYSW